jgi:mono/diheme cytochrome c family protein
MRKAVNALIVLLCSACFILAVTVDVNISGTVTKNGGGPLQGATVTLTKIKSLSTTTDAEGKFNLRGSVGVLLQMNSPQVAPLEFKGNILAVSPVSGKLSGSIDVYSGNGRRTASINLTNLQPGRQSVTLPAFNAGLNVVRVALGNEIYTCRLVCLGKNMYIKNENYGAHAERNFSLAKQAAGLKDTLIVTKSGFGSKKTPIDSYTIPSVAVTVDSLITQETGFLNASGINGGRLYSQFWAQETGYNKDDTTRYIQNPEFFRCSHCHAPDLLGRAGGYASNGPSSSSPNIANMNLWATAGEPQSDIFNDIKNGDNPAMRRSPTADLSTYNPATNSAMGDKMPNYAEILSDAQIWDLVKFLKNEAVDVNLLCDHSITGVYPTATVTYSNIGKGGNAVNGKDVYAEKCNDCHGRTGEDMGSPVGNFLRLFPFEAAQLIKFGDLGTNMTADSLSIQQLKDLYKALADSTKYP